MTVRPRELAMVIVLAAVAACANVSTRFEAGQRAFAAHSWQQAIDELERFREDADCAKDPRCKQARVDIAECRLRLGAIAEAYFALESMRQAESSGGSFGARIERLQKEAQDSLSARMTKADGAGTLSVRFTSRVREALAMQKARFFLDLHPLPTDTNAYVEGTTALVVPPTPVAAGKHELDVISVYSGRSHTGNYAYLADYKFTARSSQEIALASGMSTDVEVRVSDDVASGVPIASALHIDFVVHP